MNWYQISNKAEDSADIYLYSEIGGMDITAESFVNDLNSIESKNLTVHINSLGGSVFDGIAIYNALKDFDGKVTTKVEGIGASIASVIALAGDEILMSDNSLLMIHDPYAMTGGTAEDMRKTAELLDKIKNEIVGIYKKQTGLEDSVLNKMMSEETWFNSSEALESGFITSVSEGVEVKAEYNLANFKNITPEKVNQVLNNFKKQSIMEELKSLLNDIKSVVSNLVNSKEESNEPIEMKILDNEEVQNKISEFEKSVADLEGEKATFENEISDLTNKVNELEKSLETAKNKTEAVKVDAVAETDPSPVAKEKMEDPNLKFFEGMANMLKKKY